MFDIQEELKKLPECPGVYLMHNARDEIIYVGKAVVLKNRVRQYFQSSRNHTAKIRKMVSQVAYFEYIVTDSETEALILECNLIKEHRPKYNTMLKDDKTYPYIKVTVAEEYPRIIYTRKVKRDKAKYFGPYPNSGAVKDIIALLHKLYPIRFCNRNLSKIQEEERGCLYYHMNQCLAPCMSKISKEEYHEMILDIIDFLNGDDAKIVKQLKEKMIEASEHLEYEKAAGYRDLIKSIEKLAQQQKVTDSNLEDRDIIAMARKEKETVVAVFFVRGGKVIGREHFHLTNSEEESDSAALTAFVKQFYSGTPYLPKEIFTEYEIEEKEEIETWLSSVKGNKVYLIHPKRGEKVRLVELARENATVVLNSDLEKIKREEKRTTGAVKELENLLGMQGIKRMEAFDISNISGVDTVASMVVFENGKPKRSDYRRFRIRTVQGPDDYASMEEVLTRRFEHGLKEKEEREKEHSEEYGGFCKFPDLIMMDGGKGQVHVAEKVLNKLKLSIPVCGMVKDDNHRTRGLYFQDQEVSFKSGSEAFFYVTRMQDEAHRFAIEYHRNLRSENQVHSVLDEIKGIGPARRKALMKYYKDISKIKEADEKELGQIPGMNSLTAHAVYEFFHTNISNNKTGS